MIMSMCGYHLRCLNYGNNCSECSYQHNDKDRDYLNDVLRAPPDREETGSMAVQCGTRRDKTMKNAKLFWAGFYILISVVSLLSLSGCVDGSYRGGNRGYIRGDNRGDSGEDRHYYRDGRWYKRGPSGYDIEVSVMVTGAVIESLPPRRTRVVVEGAPYYRDDRYYYQRRPQGGYVIVPEPVKVQRESQGNKYKKDKKEKRDKRGEKGEDRNDDGNRGEHR
jgi:hypothetical protein